MKNVNTGKIIEEYKNMREFRNCYPSGFYICTRCGRLIADKYFCEWCGNQSNNFVQCGYTYRLADTGFSETIFEPIERKR